MSVQVSADYFRLHESPHRIAEAPLSQATVR